MVREMRVPSSSSSSSVDFVRMLSCMARVEIIHTNSDWFYANSFFEVGGLSIIGILPLKNLLSAQSVDEGGATCSH